jgi:hypothetical protein
METAKKTLESVLGAGTAVLEKARELPQKLDLTDRFVDLQAKVQGVPTKIQERVSEFVTLPQAIKVGPVDLRDLPATLQSYAAKGTEAALGLVGETREFLKSNVKFAPVSIKVGKASNGNGNGKAKAKASAKKTTKPRTAKKATVTTTPAE